MWFIRKVAIPLQTKSDSYIDLSSLQLNSSNVSNAIVEMLFNTDENEKIQL